MEKIAHRVYENRLWLLPFGWGKERLPLQSEFKASLVVRKRHAKGLAVIS